MVDRSKHERIALSPSRRRQRGRQRLRSDFRLAIISLFGLCTVLGILPLAVYRYFVGDWQTGTGDVVLVGIIVALVAYAWKSGRTRLAARVLALIVTFGYLVLVIFGSISVMWAFPILSAGFLLADRVFGSLSAVGTLVLTALFSGRFDTTVDLWSFVTTGVLVSIFGLIFATWTQMQRRQLASIARSDPLTGAGNRLGLRTALDECVKRFQEDREPAGLALLDLDHFKAVNDTYGHDAGDQVLIELVRQVRSHMRDQDQVFRMGGEEFVLLLPDTDEHGLVSALSKLHAHLRKHLYGPGGPVRVSIGVASLNGPDPQSWLARADRALYRAKEAGRNRLEIDGMDGSEARRA
ncbi:MULTISPECIES: GGDEF domain-containing protein [unclassified Wenzhouxiangella]|uniref:GGDEF domain-containing protein n=1 Tax=unclassified Wenzhouxiangella TaxID=2613841 RepID=UPI000E32D06A|nr:MULTISPECIES: GGDEF domain-containing protein [unclassified Wenzhouxiangella]RFF26573.1 GGDEF domain-containing protein [Wenzhouxiangella sp. 15181]RFP70188.1 GGDEF domain-containing protein [Wenzhouxiangella sp. 15190]